MKFRFSSFIGWTCAILVAALNLFAAVMKFVPVPADSEGAVFMQKLGVTGLEHYLGVLEFIIVILFLIPRTSTVGFVLMVGYTAGILATIITHGMTSFADTGVIYISLLLLTISAYVRNPELLTRLKKGTA